MSSPDLLFEEIGRAQEEDTRKRDADKAAQLLSRLFPAQREFVKDPARRKAALCPRRSGKSHAVLVYALVTALKNSDARVLVLAKVRRQAKAVYWSTIKQLCKEFELKAHFRNMELEVELPNGSLIQFAGADTQEEIDKYRGQSFNLVCIDECKSYSRHLLRELINEILRPAVTDRRGVLVMIGTPGPILNGPFYAVTTGDLEVITPKTERGYWTSRHWNDRKKKKGGFAWSLHTWTTKDNTAAPHIWEEALADHELLGVPDDDPVWLREWMGQWVPDENALVYSYSLVSDDRCDWVVDPEGKFGLPPEHTWRFVLGIDLGVKDATAFVVAAWSPTHEALHYIHAEKHANMDVDQVAQRVRALEGDYGGFDAIVADAGALGLMITETLTRHYGIPVVAAKKTEKHAHIKLLNSDMLHGRVKIARDSLLAEEWRVVQWDGRERKEVDPNCDDDASDAGLYIWRHVYHHWAKAEAHGPSEGSPEWWAQMEKQDEEQFRQQLLAEDEKPWWDKFRPSDEWILNDSTDYLA